MEKSPDKPGTASTPPVVDLKDPWLAALLAWIVPGLGHWYQQRYGKSILFFVLIGGLMMTGLSFGSTQLLYSRWDQKEYRWAYIAQSGIGTVAATGFYKSRKYKEDNWSAFDTAADIVHRKKGKIMDLALIYTIIAGLLNVFAIYDAFAGPATPEEEETSEPSPNPEPAAGNEASAATSAPADAKGST